MTEKKDFRLTQRMNSCLTAPNDSILVALKDDNLQVFSDLINEDELDINHEYVEEESSTLLHICVSQGKVDFVREILRRRNVKPDHPHKMLQKTPLHVAVENGNLILVDMLVRVSNVNEPMANGSTALHLAAVRSAAKWIENEFERKNAQLDFLAITRILLNVPGVNVECKNNIGVTPLYFAVDKGTEAVARELVRKGACITVEVDDETIEEKIEEKMPRILDGLVPNRQDNDAIENKLFHILYYEADSGGHFKEAWTEAESNNNVVNVNADNGTYTFLQYCADQVLP